MLSSGLNAFAIVACVALFALLAMKIRAETPVNQRFSTLFDGLTSKKSGAMAHPLASLARRLVYALVIVCMPKQLTFLGTIVLATCSVAIAAHAIATQPWKHAQIKKQQLVNEFAIYFTLVVSFVLTDRALASSTADALGALLITLMVALIAYNLIQIVRESFTNFRTFYADLVRARSVETMKLAKAGAQVSSAKGKDAAGESKERVLTERALVTKKTSSDSEESSGKGPAEDDSSPRSPASPEHKEFKEAGALREGSTDGTHTQ